MSRAYECGKCGHLQEPVDGKCPFCGTDGPPQKMSPHLREARDEIAMMPEKNVHYRLDGTKEEFGPDDAR